MLRLGVPLLRISSRACQLEVSSSALAMRPTVAARASGVRFNSEVRARNQHPRTRAGRLSQSLPSTSRRQTPSERPLAPMPEGGGKVGVPDPRSQIPDPEEPVEGAALTEQQLKDQKKAKFQELREEFGAKPSGPEPTRCVRIDSATQHPDRLQRALADSTTPRAHAQPPLSVTSGVKSPPRLTLQVRRLGAERPLL